LALGVAGVAMVAGLADLAANVTVGRQLDRQAPEDRSIDTALSLRPDSVRYRFIASRLAGQGGDLDRAIGHIEQGLDRSGVDPALRGEHGRLLLERARAVSAGPERDAALTAAIEALTALVEDDPNHPEYRQRLGIALALTGDFDAATDEMRRAIELAPDRPEPVQNLQEIERLQKNLS
jgi:tetratricopeptide (TPR) repeat protein